MTQNDNRRKSRRHRARWKVAVVFDNPDGEPIVRHTHTMDLSLGGMAIVSDHDARKDEEITVLLVEPTPRSGGEPKVLRARARVMSSAPSGADYRLGLKFIEWGDDSLGSFAKLVGAFEAARPRETPAPASVGAHAEPTPSLSTTGRLAQLKELAQAKLAGSEDGDLGAVAEEQVSEALKRAYEYLREFSEHLNVVKPGFSGYSILGAPEFSGLAWDAGRTDYRRKDLSPTKWLYERVSLGYRLSGHKKVRVVTDGARSVRMKQILAENKIQFVVLEGRNARGALESVTFEFPCEVTASVLLTGDFSAGCIQLRMSNVGHFGAMDYTLAPESVTDESLEEFAGFILGESHRFDRLLRPA